MLRSIFSRAYSFIFIVGDNADWAIDEEAKGLLSIAKKLGFKTSRTKKVWLNIPQIVHYASQFSILDDSIYKSRHKISVDYFHGQPEDGESYRKCFEALKNKNEISRIRVSNSSMADSLKAYGVESSKISRIPIGVDLELFKQRTRDAKIAARLKLGIPENAVVIGSFQKDGVGWGEGNEPKSIKGPDIFLAVVKELKKDIPNIFILLSGPSRGFIKNGLKELGIPFTHLFPKSYSEVPSLYDALDLYLITSREEGGPKSCLESMAKGVPLVTTRVGQAADLVVNGENAMMAEKDDVASLAKLSLEVLRDPGLEKRLCVNARQTAEANSIEAQLPLWKKYFESLAISQ